MLQTQQMSHPGLYGATTATTTTTTTSSTTMNGLSSTASPSNGLSNGLLHPHSHSAAAQEDEDDDDYDEDDSFADEVTRDVAYSDHRYNAMNDTFDHEDLIIDGYESKRVNGASVNGQEAVEEEGEYADEDDQLDDELMDRISSSPSIDDEDIDFEFVYALHTFIATVDGQANAAKGDTMVLLDDSNSYWWLVRVVKDGTIGYLPAEHIETPTERLARLNKHRNVDVSTNSLLQHLLNANVDSPQLSSTMLSDNAERQKKQQPLKKALRRRKSVMFAAPTYIEPSDAEWSTDDEEDDDEYTDTLMGGGHMDYDDYIDDDVAAAANGGDVDVEMDDIQDDEIVLSDNTEEGEEFGRGEMSVEPLRPRSSAEKDAASAEKQGQKGEEQKDALGKERSIKKRNYRRRPVRMDANICFVADPLFKDDAPFETKKISLTPNLLRDDDRKPSPQYEIKDVRAPSPLLCHPYTDHLQNKRRPSIESEPRSSIDRSSTSSAATSNTSKDRDDKKKKDKKSVLSGLFKRKKDKKQAPSSAAEHGDAESDDGSRPSSAGSAYQQQQMYQQHHQQRSTESLRGKTVQLGSSESLNMSLGRPEEQAREADAAVKPLNVSQADLPRPLNVRNSQVQPQQQQQPQPLAVKKVETPAVVTEQVGTDEQAQGQGEEGEEENHDTSTSQLQVGGPSTFLSDPDSSCDDTSERDVGAEMMKGGKMEETDEGASAGMGASGGELKPGTPPSAYLTPVASMTSGHSQMSTPELVEPPQEGEYEEQGDEEKEQQRQQLQPEVSTRSEQKPEMRTPSPRTPAKELNVNPEQASLGVQRATSPTSASALPPPTTPTTDTSTIATRRSLTPSPRTIPSTPTPLTPNTPLTPTWSDAGLKSYLDDTDEVQNLFIIVHDKSNVTPAGPEHPVVGGLFREEVKGLEGMERRLDELCAGWLRRKGILG
ncbi:hypothetical protein KEM55_006384 [Ascosphaera atra]|nr:hypothetical protein KEM55_006384 [Ascosphaera atra]